MKAIISSLIVLMICGGLANAQRAASTIESSVSQEYQITAVHQPVIQALGLTNSNNFDAQVELRIDFEKSTIPDDWSIRLETQEVTVPASTALLVNIVTTPGSIGQAKIVVTSNLKNSQLKSQNVLSVITHDLTFVLYGTLHHDDAVNQIENAMASIGPHATIDWDNQKEVNQLASEFEVAIFPIGGDRRGILGSANFAGGVSPLPLIKRLIAEGKKVLIMSEEDASMAFSELGAPDARDFFANDLGVTAEVGAQVRVDIIDDKTEPLPFTLVGNGLGPNLGQISIDINRGTVLDPMPVVQKTDVLNIREGSGALPLFFYGDVTDGVGGTRIEIEDARVVYLGFGLEAIPSEKERALVLKGILDWLKYGNPTTSVDNSEANASLSIKVGPNPVNGQALVEVRADAASESTEVYLLDILGRKVAQLHSGALTPGTHTFRLDAAGLVNGNYQAVVMLDGRSQAAAVVVRR